MRSQKLGKNISNVEIQNISINGIWLYVNGKEYFMSYEEYPWFKDAKITETYNLKLLPGGHLYWSDLDIDIELESLENPEKYPLVYR